MIDWHQVAQLRQDIGEDEFNEVAFLILDEIQETLDRMIDSCDPDERIQSCHSLKGLASNIGFTALSCAAAQAERCCGSPDLESLRATYKASREAFERHGIGRLPDC